MSRPSLHGMIEYAQVAEAVWLKGMSHNLTREPLVIELPSDAFEKFRAGLVADLPHFPKVIADTANEGVIIIRHVHFRRAGK